MEQKETLYKVTKIFEELGCFQLRYNRLFKLLQDNQIRQKASELINSPQEGKNWYIVCV